jgi:RNA polymerase-binding transcription factor DksA
MGLFSSSKKEEATPAWVAESKEIKERLFVFFDKLELKMKELCEAAIPELEETFKTDDDLYKRAHGRMLSGIKGQLDNMRQKADDVFEEKITNYYDAIKENVSVHPIFSDTLYDFRNDCSKRHTEFDDVLYKWKDALDATVVEDLETKYQDVLDEYESIKNKFTCKQCGAGIVIDKIYFITTFLTCSQCQTQNTFEPSTATRGLEQLGRELAEQRTAHLSHAYLVENEMERTLYHERHTLSLSKIGIDNKNELAKINEQMDNIEARRQASIKNAPLLYKKYLRAMFDEWNKIVPDLTIQNNKFHDNILEDFMRGHS